jgi:hypothetical protein
MPPMNLKKRSRMASWTEGGNEFEDSTVQPYSNCVFAAGRVVDGPDSGALYLRWERLGGPDDGEGGMLMLTEDTAAAVLQVLNRRVVWLLLFAVCAILLMGCSAHYDSRGAFVHFSAGVYPSEAIPMADRTPTPEVMTPEPVAVGCVVAASGWLNVRLTPNGAVVDSVPELSVVYVIRKQGDWAQIEKPAGWVAGWLLAC